MSDYLDRNMVTIDLRKAERRRQIAERYHDRLIGMLEDAEAELRRAPSHHRYMAENIRDLLAEIARDSAADGREDPRDGER